MSYSGPYRRQMSISFGGPLTPGIKYIILVTAGFFVLQLLLRGMGSSPSLAGPIERWLGLFPPAVIPGLQIWRPVTWLFVHGGIGHIVINMLFLFMFGCRLERDWGTHAFVQYYFVCGIGAALFTFLPFAQFYTVNHIGASGAVYGVLLAFGLFYPRSVIYVLATFPVEARYLLMVMGFVAFAGSLGAGGSGVSHIAHLGGLVAGYVYLRWVGVKRGRGPNLLSTLQRNLPPMADQKTPQEVRALLRGAHGRLVEI